MLTISSQATWIRQQIAGKATRRQQVDATGWMMSAVCSNVHRRQVNVPRISDGQHTSLPSEHVVRSPTTGDRGREFARITVEFKSDPRTVERRVPWVTHTPKYRRVKSFRLGDQKQAENAETRRPKGMGGWDASRNRAEQFVKDIGHRKAKSQLRVDRARSSAKRARRIDYVSSS